MKNDKGIPVITMTDLMDVVVFALFEAGLDLSYLSVSDNPL